MHTIEARDVRPMWEAPKATPGQFQLISNMAKERGISNERLVALFPKRPETYDEASVIISYLRSYRREATPSQPSAPQALPLEGIATRRDKNGKAQPSYYAIDMDDTVKFYRIKAGKFAGRYFIDAQGSDEFYPIRNPKTKERILKIIAAQGPEKAMARYGQEIGSCGHCHRTLTDAESRAIGIGPVCREK